MSRELAHERKFADITGKRFGKLVVTEYLGFNKQSNSGIYRCLCDCGNYTDVLRTALIGGNTQSCGCLVKETKHKRLDSKLGIWYGELYADKIQDYDARHPKIEFVCKYGHREVHRNAQYVGY